MSSTYTSFAVVGAGTIGKHIVDGLLAQKANIIVISRASSESKPIPGVETVKVDYSDKTALTAALKEHGVQVLISAIGSSAIDSQTTIADAAKLAGVQLFVPSEYGIVTTGVEENPKEKVAQYIQSIGIPTARVFTGIFTEYIALLSGFSKNGKVNIIGTGKTPVSTTTQADIGGFIAHIVSTLPPPKLSNQEFRIQGDRVTFQEIAQVLKTTTAQIDIEKVPKDPLSQFVVFLMKQAEAGGVSTGWEPKKAADNEALAGSSNQLWEGHHWKTIREFYN